MILGLPGEGMEQYIDSAKLIADLPVTDLKLHLLYIIKGTPMEDLFRQGAYIPLTMDEYSEAVAYFIAHLRDDIVIQRITGDPHAEELVAPAWAMEKIQAREAIHEKMKQLDLYQGRYCSR